MISISNLEYLAAMVGIDFMQLSLLIAVKIQARFILKI
jgi:hypothetical protein